MYIQNVSWQHTCTAFQHFLEIAHSKFSLLPFDFFSLCSVLTNRLIAHEGYSVFFSTLYSLPMPLHLLAEKGVRSSHKRRDKRNKIHVGNYEIRMISATVSKAHSIHFGAAINLSWTFISNSLAIGRATWEIPFYSVRFRLCLFRLWLWYEMWIEFGRFAVLFALNFISVNFRGNSICRVFLASRTGTGSETDHCWPQKLKMMPIIKQCHQMPSKSRCQSSNSDDHHTCDVYSDKAIVSSDDW